MPLGYDLNCKSVTLTTTPIANFALNVKDAAGTSLSNKTFGVALANVGSCTGTALTYKFEYNDPSAGYTTNPFT